MPDISHLAVDFAVKRRAFLDAHANDFRSAATDAAYDASEDALDALMDALRDAFQSRPEATAALLASNATSEAA